MKVSGQRLWGLDIAIHHTFPGVNLRTPEEKGANLTSTFNRALALKGAEGGEGFGPYLY